MKPSAKPISSPGRTEKFPPPLMRFLRSNVGSKSRGRSRASPMMFMRKKNNATAIETQEPSSPKVTCIGQVRVRRSSTRRSRRSGTPTRRRCRWIRAALLCPCFRKKIKPNSSQIFQRWVSFFQVGFRRKSRSRKKSPPHETPVHGGIEIPNSETQVVAPIDDDEGEETVEAFISSHSSPPKNALLLTRCRSAPYRSTSLASRFWGSPLRNDENLKEEEEEEEEEDEEHSTKPNNGGKAVEIEKPTSQRVSVSDQDPSGGLEFEEDEEFVQNIENSTTERITKSAIIEREKAGDDEDGLGSSSRPLILTRCKSEPSRTAEKMNPEIGFWKKRRLGIPDSCLPNTIHDI